MGPKLRDQNRNELGILIQQIWNRGWISINFPTGATCKSPLFFSIIPTARRMNSLKSVYMLWIPEQLPWYRFPAFDFAWVKVSFCIRESNGGNLWGTEFQCESNSPTLPNHPKIYQMTKIFPFPFHYLSLWPSGLTWGSPSLDFSFFFPSSAASGCGSCRFRNGISSINDMKGGSPRTLQHLSQFMTDIRSLYVLLQQWPWREKTRAIF